MFRMEIVIDSRYDFGSRHRYFGDPICLPDKEEPWKRQRVPNPDARGARARRLLGSRK